MDGQRDGRVCGLIGRRIDGRKEGRGLDHWTDCFMDGPYVLSSGSSSRSLLPLGAVSVH